MNTIFKSRFRQDLLIEKSMKERGVFEVSYVIVDPLTGEVYQLTPEEYFICQALDGTTPAQKILERFQAQFRQTLAQADLEAFVDQINEMGFLESESIASSLSEPDFLFSELSDDDLKTKQIIWELPHAQQICRVLARVGNQFQWLWWLLKFGLVLGVPIALLTIWNNWSLLIYDLVPLSTSVQFFVFFLVQLLGFSLGVRLIQGAIISHYRGKVSKAGIAVSYGFLLHFFIEPQNIETLKRRQLLWIFGAPLLTYLFLIVVSTVLWLSVRETGTTLKTWSLVILFDSLTAFIGDASPFWISDGYFWMVNYFRLPYLEKRAYSFWKMLLQGRSLPTALSFGERLQLFWFGIFAVIFFVLVLAIYVLIISFGLSQDLSLVFGNASVAKFLLICLMTFLAGRFLFQEFFRLWT